MHFKDTDQQWSLSNDFEIAKLFYGYTKIFSSQFERKTWHCSLKQIWQHLLAWTSRNFTMRAAGSGAGSGCMLYNLQGALVQYLESRQRRFITRRDLWEYALIRDVPPSAAITWIRVIAASTAFPRWWLIYPKFFFAVATWKSLQFECTNIISI